MEKQILTTVALPSLPALIKFDEVHTAAGEVPKHSLRRQLYRRGVMRRVGRSYFVSTDALQKQDAELYQAVVRNRVLLE